MNSVTLLGEEDRVRHGGVVPLLAVPDLVHGAGDIGSGRRRIPWRTSRNRPVILANSIHKNGHSLFRLVNVDEN
jgi:hypothetical protein